MKEQTFYEVAEKGGITSGSILLENPNAKIEKLRWCRFKTLEGAKRAVEKAIYDRKHQWFYFRDKETDKIVDKISYYERYDITYKIYKIVEQEEVVYEVNNSDEKKKQANETLQEEIPLTL